MPALVANSLVVVTGISGYIGSHVALVALQAGYRVRGTVRSLARGKSVRAGLAKQGVDTSTDRLEFVVTTSLTDQAQYEVAFRGADGVAHVAIPDLLTTPNFVEATTEAVLSALRAAKEVASVKRFVLTSTADTVYSPPTLINHVLTGEDWNWEALTAYKNATLEEKVHPGWIWTIYAAGKTLSEQAAWKWMEEQKPSFDLASILPVANYGPVLHGGPQSSATWPISLLQNDTSLVDVIACQWYVDVRDTALLHLLALTTPSAGGQRIWAAAEPSGWNHILAALRKHFPRIQVPEDQPSWETSPQKIDSEYGRTLLGGKWIPFEQSIVDTAKSAGY